MPHVKWRWSGETWQVICVYLQLPSDTERTPLESMKDRHIHHPRHKVYEANVLGLTQKVEGYVSTGGAASIQFLWRPSVFVFFFPIFSGWRSECMILTSPWGSLIKPCGKKWVVIQRKRYAEVVIFVFSLFTQSVTVVFLIAAQIFRSQT